MKERHNYELPHPRGVRLDDGTREYRPDFLEDYTTLYFRVDSLICDIEIHPDRVGWFKENYPKQIKKEVEWLNETQFTTLMAQVPPEHK